MRHRRRRWGRGATRASVVVFTGNPQPEDRNWGADNTQVKAARARLAEAEKALGNIELVIGESRSPEETQALLEQAGPDAPVLAINVENFAMKRVIGPVLDAGRPMVVFAVAGERSRLDVCAAMAACGAPGCAVGQQRL